MKKLKVGILGATGTVGQRMIQLLERHPWFEVSAVAASDNSAGKNYAQATRWMLETPIPESVAKMTVQPCQPGLDCELMLSGLPSAIAEETELQLAKAGMPVLSNASSHRMKADVPLLVPEINPDHLDALELQKKRFVDAPMRISAMTHRVNVRDGHLEAVSVKLGTAASHQEVESALRDFGSPIDELQLPSAPRPVIHLESHVQRPQPRLDRDRGQGMAVVVGPVSPCAVLDYKFRVLSHNTIRGAAGAAVLNAELMYRKGLLA